MLDRAQLARALNSVALNIFTDVRQLTWLTAAAWQRLTAEPAFLEQLERARRSKQLVVPVGPMGTLITHQVHEHPYDILAIDGSQIYPDHHLEGLDCFLINTGGCLFAYDKISKVTYISQPFIFTSQQAQQQYQQAYFSPDLVDLIREDHEFAAINQQVQEYKLRACPFVVLFDGNLFFWHLEQKYQPIKEHFLRRYIDHLTKLYEQGVVYGGYLSGTQFSDLTQLVQQGLCENSGSSCGLGRTELYDLCSGITGMTDAQLLRYVLVPGQRTTVFACNHDLVDYYPDHSKPYFFYLNTGKEMVRIEVPAWIARDEKLLDVLCRVCLDQCAKGNGYPVALAEAHAQAVVNTSDREFFYQLVYNHSVKQNRQMTFSQKSMKKKLLGV